MTTITLPSTDNIFVGPSDRILKVITPGKHNLYFKFKKGTKTAADIKNFIFNNYKYSCDNYNDPEIYDFKLNDIKLSDIVSEDIKPTDTPDDLILRDKLNREIIDMVAKFNNHLTLNINYDKIKKNTNTIYSSSYDSIKHLFEEGMNLYVKTLNGRTILINCNPENVTVGQFKLAIYNKEGIPVDQQRVLYNGRQLDDNNLLSSYNVETNRNLYLALRLKGGMFNEVSGRNGNFQPLSDIFFDLDAGYDFVIPKVENCSNYSESKDTKKTIEI
jgi:ubiquitin-large subunit ribosomal protein L40e